MLFSGSETELTGQRPDADYAHLSTHRTKPANRPMTPCCAVPSTPLIHSTATTAATCCCQHTLRSCVDLNLSFTHCHTSSFHTPNSLSMSLYSHSTSLHDHSMSTSTLHMSDQPLLDTSTSLTRTTTGPTPPLTATDVHFPPPELADFVIHYRGTSYHVHKFLLTYHSSYFRAYILQLKGSERSYAADECDGHAGIAHCIRLPDDVMESCRCNTADHFQLFLAHLYFAQHYCCPPYRHRTHLSLDGQPLPPITLTYPHLPWKAMLPHIALWQSTSFADLPPLSMCVLSLAHYLDCAVLLEQCETNCLTFIHNLTPTSMQNNTNSVWTLFDLSSKYGLVQLKSACIPLMVNHRDVQYKGRWLNRQQELDKDTLFEVVKVALKLQ